MVRCWWMFLLTMLICILFGRKKNSRKKCVVLVTILMVLFSGLRSWWFGDLIKYYTRYINDVALTFEEIYANYGLRNIGLSVLYKIAFFFFGEYGYDVLIFLIALFSGVSLAKMVIKHSPSPYWSYFIYISLGFYMFTFSGLKQTIAMAILCYAMDALLEERYTKSLLFVLIASMFHTPALIFVLSYSLTRLTGDKSYWFYVIGIIGGMLIFRTQILSILSESYSGDLAAVEYLAKGSGGVGGRFLMMVFIMVVAVCFRPLSVQDEKYTKVFSVMVLAAAMQTLSIYDNVFTRLADYFYQFSVLFVPMFMEPITNEEDLRIRKFGLLTNNWGIIFMASVCITALGMWFFSNQIRSVDYLGGLLFFWERNGHMFYGG